MTDYFAWLSLCFILLLASFSLLFFRKRIASWIATHQRATTAFALVLAAIMLAVSVIPILVIAFHSA